MSATSPGGRTFGTMYREADGPWEMRQAVREQLSRGADFVKVMTTGARSIERENPEPAQMTREELHAVVDEAHRLGLRVAAHAEGLEGTRMAIEEGVDTIEHGLSLHRDPALLELMAERGAVLVPTLTTFHDLAERFAPEFAPALVDQAKRQLDEAYLTLNAARDAGVLLAMGFDTGPPGANAAELVRMVDGGLSAPRGSRPLPRAPRARSASTSSARSSEARLPISWWSTAIPSPTCECSPTGRGSGSCSAKDGRFPAPPSRPDPPFRAAGEPGWQVAGAPSPCLALLAGDGAALTHLTIAERVTVVLRQNHLR